MSNTRPGWTTDATRPGGGGKAALAALLALLALCLEFSLAPPALAAVAQGGPQVAAVGAQGGPQTAPAGAPGGQQVAAAASPLAGWTGLRYTTSKLIIFSGEVTMAKSLAAGRISVRTESRAKLFGAELVNSWSVSTLDAETGRPLEFLSVRPRKRAERWELSGEALSRTIRKPHPDSPDEPMEQWPVTQKKTWPPIPLEPAAPGAGQAPGAGAAASPTPGLPASAPPVAETGPAAAVPVTGVARAAGAAPAAGEAPLPADPSTWVHDYIAMLVRLGALPLHKVGDSATVRVATSRGAAPLRVSVGEERTEYRNLTNLATGRNARYQLRELRLRVAPLAGSPPDASGFMDMEGETELWVDAQTRTLVEISGTIPKVPGRVVITLAGYR